MDIAARHELVVIEDCCQACGASAQLGKIERILDTLRAKKMRLKAQIQGIPAVGFRNLNDPEGDCSTLLTGLFKSRKMADRVCEKLGAQRLSHSGWHVYSNMEQMETDRVASRVREACERTAL